MQIVTTKAYATSHESYVDVGYLPIDVCPICNFAQHFRECHIELIGDPEAPASILWIVFRCQRFSCQQVFLVEHRAKHEVDHAKRVSFTVYQPVRSFPSKNNIAKEFGESIKRTSPMFPIIFNQANAAENAGLAEICGAGFRRALEFLIKDYAISKNGEHEKTIKEMNLAPCISKYVSDSRIKELAKRATWLGNDETHYERRWEGKTLKDLKVLIELTVHSIESEALADGMIDGMPEPKK